ncbi:TauD/TfdA family dioxygenase [Saccharothrix syringae]|uniref:Peptide synthase n=1 Tax=Saccharothrix syringae TaxID=103733 RepID=A0A5Q0H5U4_SACSY|nr:TauD/TfdA family dioxygenase [Saccharothrix syringae]QFZ21363.1 peptide synthase [Saccharothrix syringae]
MNTSPGAGGSAFRRIEHGPHFEVPVRHREFLAGSEHENFPDSVPDIGDMIPVLGADGSVSPAAVRAAVDEALPRYGGVLLRGLPLTAKAGFEHLVANLGYDRTGYEGGIAVRANDAGVALNASQEDHRITLSPHNEMAYLPNYPRRILFFCESAATSGGEVPVNDIRETGAIIPEDVKRTFRDKGIRYHRNLARENSNGEMGWVATFRTEDKGAIEEHLTASGFDFEWGGEDELRYHYRREAFTAHPETGEELWFNQVTELHCSYWRSHPHFPPGLPDHEYPATTAYGDGSPIDEELISFLRGALWRTTRAVRMSPGDVLVLDNQVLQHGRFAFDGPRRHFVSLTR